jgi:hypothetical protein
VLEREERVPKESQEEPARERPEDQDEDNELEETGKGDAGEAHMRDASRLAAGGRVHLREGMSAATKCIADD